MTNEEIVKELRDVIDCIANEEPITATRTALTIIEKLKPKPLFVLGPAKYTDGTDCNILAIHTDDEQGMLTEYKLEGNGWWISRHNLDGKGTDQNWDVMPNNESEEKYKCKICGGEINKGEFDTFELCDGCWDKPEEKVYGPQKCNDTVKLCMNCEHEGETVCFSCHGRDKWAPVPTIKELWKRVLVKLHPFRGV